MKKVAVIAVLIIVAHIAVLHSMVYNVANRVKVLENQVDGLREIVKREERLNTIQQATIHELVEWASARTPKEKPVVTYWTIGTASGSTNVISQWSNESERERIMREVFEK